MGIRAEIAEQPEVWRRLLTGAEEVLAGLQEELARRPFDYVLLVARGSSDNAGLYAKYLWQIRLGWPVALAAPSLWTRYRAQLPLSRSLVVGISQSGASPDLIEVMEEARRQGAATLAITNSPGSGLAEAAERVLDLGAGPETAVAATKSYSAQLLAVALVACAVAPRETDRRELEETCAQAEEILAAEAELKQLAHAYREARSCVVLGRGYHFATAHEWSLKLQELTALVAAPYSTADFRHGPIAMVGEDFPVFAVASGGPVLDDVRDVLARLRQERRVDSLVLSDSADLRGLGRRSFPLPETAEWLSPLTAIVPAQLFTYHLAIARGLDPESPRGLGKITRSR